MSSLWMSSLVNPEEQELNLFSLPFLVQPEPQDKQLELVHSCWRVVLCTLIESNSNLTLMLLKSVHRNQIAEYFKALT